MHEDHIKALFEIMHAQKACYKWIDEFHSKGKVDVFLCVKIEGEDVYRFVTLLSTDRDRGISQGHGEFGILIKQV